MAVFIHLSYSVTDHFEGATTATENTPWWWHLSRAATL